MALDKCNDRHLLNYTSAYWLTPNETATNLCNQLFNTNAGVATFNNLITVIQPIGPQFDAFAAKLGTNHSQIEWVTEMPYLGLDIKSGRSFKCSFHAKKIKYQATVVSTVSLVNWVRHLRSA